MNILVTGVSNGMVGGTYLILQGNRSLQTAACGWSVRWRHYGQQFYATKFWKIAHFWASPTWSFKILQFNIVATDRPQRTAICFALIQGPPTEDSPIVPPPYLLKILPTDLYITLVIQIPAVTALAKKAVTECTYMFVVIFVLS